MYLKNTLVILCFTFLFHYVNAQSSIDKLLAFQGQKEGQIRNYEGDDYMFMASIGSYYGNTYTEAVEKEEALDGLVISMPLYNEDSEVTLYYGAPNSSIISRIETGLSKNQGNLFIQKDVHTLNLKKINTELKDKIIWSNEKFVFVIRRLYDEITDYKLEIYPLKDLKFVMNGFDISAPNQ